MKKYSISVNEDIFRHSGESGNLTANYEGKNIKTFGEQEANTRGVLSEKVLLEISQKSQENTCAGDSFLIKLQA